MIFFLFTLSLLLFGCSHSALAKPALDDNIIDSFAQSALTSTSETNAFPDYLFRDEATTPNPNPSISWASPSSGDLQLSSEPLPKNPADINSFTSSKSLCQDRTQTNGKLRIRDQQQPAFCKSPYSQQIKQPELPSIQLLPHATDYGSDYEQHRPAVSPKDGALSEKDRENALREQNKALSDDDPLKCARPPFFIPVCCLGSLDLADLMVEGQTIFDQVEYCVSCKLVFVFFSLTNWTTF